MINTYQDFSGVFLAWLLERGIQTDPQTLIRLAEDELAGDPRLFVKKKATLTLSTAGIVKLPKDLAEILAWTLGSPWSTPLDVASERDSASLALPGTPQTYHIVDGNAYLRPVPSETISSDLTYRPMFLHLGPDRQTNGYIEDWPALYWYACLEQACDYSARPDLMMLGQQYSRKKDKLVRRVKSFQERKVLGGSPTRRVELGGSSRGF